MIKTILIILCVVALTTFSFAQQEPDILDCAAKKTRISQGQAPDKTRETSNCGDYQLEQAVERLKNYSHPFTVPKVISWYSKAKDQKIRAALLRVLAFSRDPRAAVVLGNSLQDDLLDVRLAATAGLMDHFMRVVICCGTESDMIAVQEWWEENRQRLEKEATRSKSKDIRNKSFY